jgi:SNF2 family DNA or RNA helicase
MTEKTNTPSDAELAAVYAKLKTIRTRSDLSARSTALLRTEYVALDGTMRPVKLRYYQVQGVLHLLAMRRFLLGDDTGLGKTIQTITALCYLWEKAPERKVFVLTTKSATGQWIAEFARFTTGVKTFLARGNPTQRTEVRKAFLNAKGPSVLVMGYRSAVQDFSQIQDWKDFIFVTDEATAFKNPSTQVGQVVKHLSENADRSWGLTATLIKNSLIEGWGIYWALVPGLFGSKNSFMNEYCITRLQKLPGSKRQIPVIVGYRDKDVASFREKIDPYFLGRPKHEVAKELPPLTVKTVECELTPLQEEKYAEALSGILEIAKDKEVREVEVTKLTAVTYCQQIVNHPELIGIEGESDKLDTLLDLLAGEFDGDKVIVFSRFRKMVDIIVPALKKAGIDTVRITGSENEKERKTAQDAFQNAKSDTRVICITAAGSEAINLQAAKAIIFYDTPWSAGDYLQLLGRMIRIGSLHDNVFALHLVVKKTIDERVAKIMSQKLALIEKVLGKRIKGESDDVMVSVENDLSDLFDALRADAKAAKE